MIATPRWRVTFPLIALLLAGFDAAWAEDADALFRQGAFAQAVTAGRAMNSAHGDALAARSMLAIAAYRTSSKAQAQQQIEQAILDARRALSRDPANIEGMLQLAIGMGYKAKLARSPGLAKDARRVMDKVYAAAPGNPFASAVLAGWHGEAVADLGKFIAGSVLGAKLPEARRLYEEAIARDPASPTFPAFYAFNLIRLDEKANRAQAMALLQQASRLPARDGFEAMMREHAADVLQAMKSGEPKRVLALVKAYQPFGGVN